MCDWIYLPRGGGKVRAIGRNAQQSNWLKKFGWVVCELRGPLSPRRPTLLRLVPYLHPQTVKKEKGTNENVSQHSSRVVGLSALCVSCVYAETVPFIRQWRVRNGVRHEQRHG